MITGRKGIFFIPLAIAVVSIPLFFLAVSMGWFGIADGYGARYCEVGGGWVKQPVNTYSNIAFVLVGLLIGWSEAKGKFSVNTNLFTRSKFMPLFFAILGVILGPASMALHATETSFGGFLDLFSMYLIASFAFSYAFMRYKGLNNLGFIITFIIILFLQVTVERLPITVPLVGLPGDMIFGVVLLSAGILETIRHYKRNTEIDIKYIAMVFLVMAIALFIWKKSHTGGPWCNPESLLQGHGVWHVLCAAAVYFAYRLYASENDAESLKMVGK